LKIIEKLKRKINSYSNKEYAIQCERFHKTDKGGYAEKDLFLGIDTKTIRRVANEYYKVVKLEEVKELLVSRYQEYRFVAVIILVNKYNEIKKGQNIETRCDKQKDIVEFYLENAKKINGWGLVDCSAPYIVGEYVYESKKYDVLYKLAESSNMWEQRIAVVSNITLIRKGEFESIIKIADILISSEYDLIQKAVGWMLREMGKKNYKLEYSFLKSRYRKMPRTMLRYSIEKFEETIRQKFLKGEI